MLITDFAVSVTKTQKSVSIRGYFLSILQQKELLFLLFLLDKTKKERLLLQPLLVVIPLGIIPQQR